MSTTEKTTTAARAPSMLDAKHAQPLADGKPNILRFGDGLMLWVTPRQKMWRGKVSGGGSTLNLGRFPDLSPKEAKAKYLALKLASADPAQARRDEIAAAKLAGETTLALVAERWTDETSTDERWTANVTTDVRRRLAKHVLPVWGARPIGAITKDDVRVLIRAVHQRRTGRDGRADGGPATGVAVKQYISAIFDYAVNFDMIAFNPVKAIARHLPRRKQGDEKPNAHVRTIEEARAVLAAVEARRRPEHVVPGWRGAWVNPWTLLAHRLIALTGVRKNEALEARWSEFDLKAAVWTIPAERTKQRRTHVVPLAPQTIEVIRAALALRKSEFVFPACGRGRKGQAHLSDDTVNTLMRRALDGAKLGQIMVPHGWRHTFSTIMNEADFTDAPVIDLMIAHKPVGNSHVEARYNHARHDSARHRIACLWADMLLDGAPSALSLTGLEAPVPASNVVTLRRRAAA